ncbi:family 16 glycosylhydrolase [Croceivirga sp. JEA036]|uniref:family 16 glycosylhydrolase n=1 Tax=Croceivirga sp. JEA036 TaxID=2721162 RepID=UPI00143A0343|nr:family 16 glycosylhydrolase [Croceivirga sp. JEA036]NJB35202.1 family 16 glycosylhydrolase [Croceivirga sp. JEA036]
MEITYNYYVLSLAMLLGFFGYGQNVHKGYGPPIPPMGKRWVMNPDFSDEFNGTALDTTKWLDHHPTWIGRKPGLFMASQVTVADGYLQLKGAHMGKDTLVNAYGKVDTFNIKGAAVVSKKKIQFGYYETRVKAAATTMSTTFWFSTVGNFKGPKDCDSYGLEWDIHESIGRKGDFDGQFFASGMHANAHFWYNDCEGKRHDFRAPQVRFEDERLTSEDFNVYGGWWKNESEASLYYNHRPPKHQRFYDKIKQQPFDQPMYMRLVSETYPYPWIALPNKEELADSTKNVVYYDWVRAYQLVPVNQYYANADLERELKLYQEGIYFNAANITLTYSPQLKIPMNYKANEKRLLVVELWNAQDKKLMESSMEVLPGFGHFQFDLYPKMNLKREENYRISVKLKSLTSNDPKVLDYNTIILNLE